MMLSRGNGGVLVEFRPMSPEEIQRTMQFLLTQQAQFAADIENLTAKTGAATDAIISLTGIVGRVTESQDEALLRLHGIVGRIVESQDGLSGVVGRLAERQDSGFAELRQYVETVESHLNVLIEVFERHIREDHGQRPS